MGEIKISVSEKMDNVIQDISDEIGIKKTEFIKSLVIESLKEIKFRDKKAKWKIKGEKWTKNRRLN